MVGLAGWQADWLATQIAQRDQTDGDCLPDGLGSALAFGAKPVPVTMKQVVGKCLAAQDHTITEIAYPAT
jgi:hypothetical protein